MTILERIFRGICAMQAGAQIFFTIATTQVIFASEIAALPRSDPRRALAADQVGALLLRIDAMTLIVAAIAVGLAFLAANRGLFPRRRALWPLLAGLLAIASLFGTTPEIHALRAANRTGEPIFGAMHALSTILLILEIAFFICSAFGGKRAFADAAGAAQLDEPATSR